MTTAVSDGARVIQGRDSSGLLRDLSADAITDGLVVIDAIHNLTHTGNMHVFSIKGTVAIGATGYFLGRVGTIKAHLLHYYINTNDGPVDITFYEAPTISVVGTLQTVRNKNRNYADTNNLSVYTGPTVTGDGTLLYTTGVLASAQGSHFIDSAAIDPDEWVLAANTDYLFKVVNTSGRVVTFLAHWQWLELPI